MKEHQKTLYLVQGALIAALYVVLTLVAAGFDLASGAIQVRISEALCILPFFTPAAVPGLWCAGNAGTPEAQLPLLPAARSLQHDHRPAPPDLCLSHPGRHPLFHADRRSRRSALDLRVRGDPAARPEADPRQGVRTFAGALSCQKVRRRLSHENTSRRDTVKGPFRVCYNSARGGPFGCPEMRQFCFGERLDGHEQTRGTQKDIRL